MTGKPNGVAHSSGKQAGARNGAEQPNGKPANGVATVREAIAAAAPVADAGVQMPAGFEMRENGLWRVLGEGKAPFRVTGRFEIIAETRPEDGEDWGLLLRWQDRDGKPHEWIMPRRLLAGEAVAVREHLAACGLHVDASDGARRALVQFLASVSISTRMRTVPHTGWYRPVDGGAVFVLPERTIGNLTGEVVRLNIDGGAPNIYQAKGTLEGWQREVAARCLKNSRLMFGVACAFAAPLLEIVGTEGGGFNLRGESSKGKTTIIDAAASVWGAPSKSGPHAFVRQWRTTSNALEATAAAHNHVLLPMDEMGQADPKEVPETLYMLANGTGKDRARAGGGNRKAVTFRTLVLSSSEESAARMAEQGGKRIKAGQEVRLLDIPAVVPGGHGCFDELHGAADGATFAQLMAGAARGQHGTAGPAFVGRVATTLGTTPTFPAELSNRIADWCSTHVPASADGQVQRAGRRLGLVAVAGELASSFGLTGWPEGAVAAAIATVFREWMAERGGTGSREDMHLFAALRRFIGAHGSSRFEPLRPAQPDDAGAQTEPALPEGPKTIQRAGWRWQEATEAGEQVWKYGMLPEIFDGEIAGPLGMEGQDGRARLGKAGVLHGVQESGKTRWTIKTRIPGAGRPRLMVIDPTILQDTSEV